MNSWLLLVLLGVLVAAAVISVASMVNFHKRTVRKHPAPTGQGGGADAGLYGYGDGSRAAHESPDAADVTCLDSGGDGGGSDGGGDGGGGGGGDGGGGGGGD